MRVKSRHKEEHFLGKLTIPVHICMMSTVIEYTRQIGCLLSLSATEMLCIENAVKEAFANSVADFSPPIQANDHIHAEFVATPQKIVISIREKGIPFGRRKTDLCPDRNALIDQNPKTDTIPKDHGMDKIEQRIIGREGKETRLTKYFKSGALPQGLLKLNISRDKPQHTLKDKPVIRLTELNELEDVIRLAWKCYGYTQEAFLYDIDALTQKVETGELISIIAIDTNREEIIGHIGLKHHDNTVKVPEMGFAFVDPAYRNSGLALALGKKAMEFAQINNYAGIFDCSVTTHTFSQQGMQTIGSRPCGIFLGIVAAGMQARQIDASNQAKGSVVNHYYAFDRSERTVYVPAHHQDMVAQIYEWLELPRHFNMDVPKQVHSPSNTSVFEMPEEHNAAIIIVDTIGKETAQEVASALGNFKRKRIDAVYAFLPIESCFLPKLVDQLEKTGFSFAGIMPHIHNGEDRLLMQYSNIPINPSVIKVYGTMTHKLFDYILNEQSRVQ